MSKTNKTNKTNTTKKTTATEKVNIVTQFSNINNALELANNPNTNTATQTNALDYIRTMLKAENKKTESDYINNTVKALNENNLTLTEFFNNFIGESGECFVVGKILKQNSSTKKYEIKDKRIVIDFSKIDLAYRKKCGVNIAKDTKYLLYIGVLADNVARNRYAKTGVTIPELSPEKIKSRKKLAAGVDFSKTGNDAIIDQANYILSAILPDNFTRLKLTRKALVFIADRLFNTTKELNTKQANEITLLNALFVAQWKCNNNISFDYDSKCKIYMK